MMKKRFGKMFALILCLSFCLSQGLFDGLSMFSSVIEVQAASAPKGIYGNGTGGINIDVNAEPFITFKNYNYGWNAYLPEGCAWFASARVNQLTGKGNTIWGGPGWYNTGASALGFSKGSSIKAPAVLCWSGHVAILEKISGNTAYISEGGGWPGNGTGPDYGYTIIRSVQVSKVKTLNDGFLGCVYLPASSVNHPPVGCVDSVTCPSDGKVRVKGWAYDADKPSKSLALHIYIGGGYGSGAPMYTATANTSRDDVNKTFNITGKHGFDVTISTTKTGNQPVYIYAIDAQVEANHNTQLEVRTVNIIKDKTKPTISDVKVSNRTKDGYTVTCNVSDNVGVTRVLFPSWNTDKHKGEDANWVTGQISGNTATARINLSSLKSGVVEGNYATHVYAYDAAGNSSMKTAPGVYIDRTAPKLSKPEIVYRDSLGYVMKCKVEDKSKISKVEFPTWTEKNGQDDLKWKNGVAKKDGTYHFRVNISDHNNEYGQYWTHVYATDEYGNRGNVTYPDIIVTKGYIPAASGIYENHLYAAFNENPGWKASKEMAESMGGTLAVLFDREETEFVTKWFADLPREYYFLGLYQENKDSAYQWVTGEEPDYTNWADKQPDCSKGKEFYGALSTSSSTLEAGKWNDLPASPEDCGFIVEIDIDMPSCLEREVDGKKYAVYDKNLPYDLARQLAEEKGGHLLTINSVQDREEIADMLSGIDTDIKKFMLGGTDREEEGVFKWDTGEVFDLSVMEWEDQEPNNWSNAGGQDILAIDKQGKMDDISASGNYGFIVEYDLPQPDVTESPTPMPSPSTEGEETSSPTLIPENTPTAGIPSASTSPTLPSASTSPALPPASSGVPVLSPSPTSSGVPVLSPSSTPSGVSGITMQTRPSVLDNIKNGVSLTDNKNGTENNVATSKPSKVKALKVKGKKKSFRATWEKQSGISGYQIQYAKDRKLKKGKKSKFLKKNKLTIKKLKKNKKYYFRVRAYKTENGKKVYGKWSKVKTVRIK